MPLFGINNGRDVAQAFGQIGPRIAQGQYRGMQLGQQRARDQGNFDLRSQEQQRMLMELQQRISQAQAENEFRIQQLQQQRDAQGEIAKYHEGMLGVASNKLQNAQSKKQADKWIVTPQGFLLNQATGEVKAIPPELGQLGGQGKIGTVNPTGLLGSFNPAIDAGIRNPSLINSNPTNTAYNPGIASMYSQGTNLQSQLAQRVLGGLGQPRPMGPPGGQTNAPPQIPGQAAPSVSKFRFDPGTGTLIPQ